MQQDLSRLRSLNHLKYACSIQLHSDPHPSPAIHSKKVHIHIWECLLYLGKAGPTEQSSQPLDLAQEDDATRYRRPLGKSRPGETQSPSPPARSLACSPSTQERDRAT